MSIRTHKFAPHADLDGKLSRLVADRRRAGTLSEPLTLREISEAVGCSHETIRMIEKRAIRKLRAGLVVATNGEVLR